MELLKKIEQEQMRREINFRPGDTVRVHVRIKEGEKERIQEAAQKDVERILQQAREEVEFRKRRAITELKQFAVELSFQHAEADLQKQLDAGTRQRLREDFVHSMEAKL